MRPSPYRTRPLPFLLSATLARPRALIAAPPVLALALLLSAGPVAAQSSAPAGTPSGGPGRGAMAVDPGLARTIAGIRAIDNHAHPMRPVPPGAPPDTEYDALPLDKIPPFPLPWRLTLASPVWSRAAGALYGPAAADTDAAGRKALETARDSTLRALGPGFPDWALDEAGIQVMFANRIAMGPGLDAKRFRWVPFDDALLFPLDTRREAARTPDTRSLYPKEAALLQHYLDESGFHAPPRSLDEYIVRVIVPTLERQKKAGAVAIKFEAAYLRSLDFAAPDPAAAHRVYAKYVRGGAPTLAEYRTLEDYLFRVIAHEAGQLGLPVHIHVLETFGGYYDAAGARPERLEPVFDDSTLRSTQFVMLHGGWPAWGETEAMISKPNVYADFSMMDQMLAPSELAGVLEHWLMRFPDKVLFGTDSFEGGPDQGWEEGAWVASHTARRALGMALTRLMREGEIDRSRARELARMVLRDNAIRLYHLDLKE
jgi:predicted TIM-barrel fold metal-dependent hydrolase